MTQKEFEMRIAALKVERDKKCLEIQVQRIELVNKISEAKNEYYRLEYELRTIIRDLDEQKRAVGNWYNEKELEAYFNLRVEEEIAAEEEDLEANGSDE